MQEQELGAGGGHRFARLQRYLQEVHPPICAAVL